MVRWVLLERYSTSSPLGEHKRRYRGLLKCLDCGWVWKSRCKYADGLPLHKERSRKGMTDQDILRRLQDGSLWINSLTSAVWSYYRGKATNLKVVEDQHGSGYRFVTVCDKGRKKKIAVHRLQWMSATGHCIPDGFDVHHKKSPPRPQEKDNALSNLDLLPSSKNRSRCCDY